MGPACQILDFGTMSNMKFKIAIKLYKITNPPGDMFDYPRHSAPGILHIYYMSIRRG